MSSTPVDARRPRRLDAYIRVSQVRGRAGDTFISPKIQQERIEAWAAANGHEIIAAHHELDVSGSKMDRPLLNEVMRRIEEGETEGVVVFKLDRFGRTLIGALGLIERISAKDALFASVSDGFDITTDTGMLVLRILLSLAEFELARIRGNWRDARNEAVERGIHVASRAPFGYRFPLDRPRNPRTGRLEPMPLEVDPVRKEAVQGIFKRRAAGQKWTEIRDWLNESEVPTSRGGKWATPTIMNMVGRRVYLGEAQGGFNGGTPGAHPQLIDEATWHAAQQRRSRATRQPIPTILRGLLRCANCRYTMTPHSPARRNGGPGDRAIMFGCKRGQLVGDCPHGIGITAIGENGAIGAEDVIVDAMWAELERITYLGIGTRGGIEELRELAEAAWHDYERTRDDTELEQALGRADMLKRLSAFKARAEAAQAQLDRMLAEHGGPLGGQTVAELREKWESGEMGVEEKRRLLGSVVRMIFVRDSQARTVPGASDDERRASLAARLHVVWTWGDDVDVPRQGRLPFDAESAPTGYRLRPFPSDTDPGEVWVPLA